MGRVSQNKFLQSKTHSSHRGQVNRVFCKGQRGQEYQHLRVGGSLGFELEIHMKK